MKYVLIYVKFVEEDVFCNKDMMVIVIVTQIIDVKNYVMLQIVKKNFIDVIKIMVIMIFIIVMNLITYVVNNVHMIHAKIVVNY